MLLSLQWASLAALVKMQLLNQQVWISNVFLDICAVGLQIHCITTGTSVQTDTAVTLTVSAQSREQDIVIQQ